MHKITFSDIFELSEFIADKHYELLDKVGNSNYLGLSVVADYYCISDLLNRLIKNTDFEILECELESDDDEYLLQITANGDIFVQRAISNGKYIRDYSDIFLIHHECKSGAYSMACQDSYTIEFSFDYDYLNEDEYDDCDGDCENCELHNEQDSSPIIQISLSDLYEIIDEYLDNRY